MASLPLRALDHWPAIRGHEVLMTWPGQRSMYVVASQSGSRSWQSNQAGEWCRKYSYKRPLIRARLCKGQSAIHLPSLSSGLRQALCQFMEYSWNHYAVPSSRRVIKSAAAAYVCIRAACCIMYASSPGSSRASGGPGVCDAFTQTTVEQRRHVESGAVP